MREGFFDRGRAALTVMVQADRPERIRELVALATPVGAEAFGMQIEQLRPEFRTPEVYRSLFAATQERPVYVTNYRTALNEGKNDEELAQEMLTLAECGADLCDVMGDYFDHQAGELTDDPVAIARQKDLIAQLHARGARVLMSSHVFRFTPAERVLEIARAHEARGADVCKIVTGAGNRAEEMENLRIITLLKEQLHIPFLFLCVGECRLLRRIGGELGCCMYLCVYEQDRFATAAQPLLRDVKAIRDHMPSPA